MSGYYPAGATTQMIDERYAEPVGPFSVEIELPGGFELWNWELPDYQLAVSEAQTLCDHGFGWRIVGAQGKCYCPNLKPRKVA